MEVYQQDLQINEISTHIRISRPTGNSTTQHDTVIFVHGNPGSSEDWEFFLPKLGEHYQVIAPDLPGYGQSERPAPFNSTLYNYNSFNYNVSGFAQHLKALCDELNISSAHWVLHDFGGPWGMQLASEEPSLFKSLTLINIGVLPNYRWHRYARIWRTPVLGELFQRLSRKWALNFLLSRDNPVPLPRSFTDRMYRYNDWASTRGMLELYRSTPSLGDLTEALGTRLKSLRFPTLVLWGKQDAYISSDYAELQRQFFDSEEYILDNCGHWPMIDAPSSILKHLEAFLAKQTSNNPKNSIAA